MDENIKFPIEVTMKQILNHNARNDELIRLRAQLAEWERVGNAIMLCATGKEAPLSDSDVCGVIMKLRGDVVMFRMLWEDAIKERDFKENEIETTIGILGGNEDSDLVQLARTVAELCAE